MPSLCVHARWRDECSQLFPAQSLHRYTFHNHSRFIVGYLCHLHRKCIFCSHLNVFLVAWTFYCRPRMLRRHIGVSVSLLDVRTIDYGSSND